MVDINDTIDLTYMQQVLVQGVIVEISEGKAYIDIPATRVVMSVQQSLAPVEPVVPEVERHLAGLAENNQPATSAAQEVVNLPPPNEEIARPQAPVAIAEPETSLRNMNFNTDALDRD
jgi:hypothetical protein